MPLSLTNLCGFGIALVAVGFVGRLGQYELSVAVLATSIYNVTGFSVMQMAVWERPEAVGLVGDVGDERGLRSRACACRPAFFPTMNVCGVAWSSPPIVHQLLLADLGNLMRIHAGVAELQVTIGFASAMETSCGWVAGALDWGSHV